MAEQFIASRTLPHVLQSTKLKNFFDSTVDQWFKNENSTFEKGFVGQRQGRLLNATKDSYISEPTVDRINYQLEPATVVRNADTQTISYQSTYDDVVNKIRYDGGNVKKHSRLFESSYYSYAPPIDVDKYLNYANYYWYPLNDSLTTETSGAFASLPSKPIDGSSTTSITLPTDIVGKKSYTAPDGTVFTNGLHIRFEGSYITGASYQYFYAIGSATISTAGSGYVVNDAIKIGTTTVGKVLTVNGSGGITAVEITEKSLADGVYPGSVTITSSAGTSGVIAIATTRTAVTFIIEGVGREIKLIDTRTLRSINDSSEAKKDYVTVERGARDGNLWSKSNGWVHKDTLENYPSVSSSSETDQLWDDDSWDTSAFDVQIIQSTSSFQRTSARRALRPILEFKKDIELYDYGAKHLRDVTVIENTLSKTQVEGQSSIVIDGHLLQNQDTILFPNASSQDDYVKWDGDSVLWDHDTDSNPATGGGGGTGGDQGWDVSNTAFDVASSIWKVSGVGTSITLTKVVSTLVNKDKVYIEKGSTFKGTEWYYDGVGWNEAQLKTASNQPPLYNLYDNNQVLLSDTGTYASSNFTGSKIFGFKTGSGSINDAELGFALSYSSGSDRSDIQFSNFLYEDTYTDGSNNITGYKYYKQFTYPETIAENIDYEVNVNPSLSNEKVNKYYINGQEAPALILVRGNTYNFKFSSPESSATGYSNASHPFYISNSNTGWASFTKTLVLNDVVTLKKGDVITQNNNSGVTATVKADITKNATVILDQEINTQNAGQFITGASNTLLVNGVAMKTDPDSPGTPGAVGTWPPVDAYPNTFTQTGFNNEYTGGVTGSRAYYGGTSSVLKFTVPANAPNTLYYHCGVHNNMGGSFVVVDNSVSTLDDATKVEYKNEWLTDPSNKISQKMVHEHTVSNRNLTTPLVLEVIPTSVLDIDVYKNGTKLVFGTDYTMSNSVMFNFTTDLIAGDFIKVYYRTNNPNPLKAVNYYEIPKNLQNNASNENVGTTTYSEVFEHFKSIIQAQPNFTGSVNGSNNYRDTAKNLSLGSVILQHDAPLLKTMAIANNSDIDMLESLRYTKDRYQEFQLKFLNAVNNIQNTNHSLNIAQVVDQAITNLNISKSTNDPYAYSNLIASGDRYTAETHTITTTNRTWGTQSTFLNLNTVTQEIFNLQPGLMISSSFDPDADYKTKALYIYKNNVQMLINHDYIVDQSSKGTKVVFLGRVADKPQVGDIITIRYYETKQPTWIPSTPASLGVAKIYKPTEISDTVTYSSGTRNFIQCHDGTLVLKYNDLRDTALLELEKRIYNTLSHVISDQDKIASYEPQQVIPTKFNSTSWQKKEIDDIMRPIFSRWTNENAVNYQENTGYAETITLDGNANYLVTNYVNAQYVQVGGSGSLSNAVQKFVVGEEIIGSNSGAQGIVTSVSDDTNTITINSVVDKFLIDEVILGSQSKAGRKIDTVNVDWRVINYSSLQDQEGVALPGHWRGIYRWFYGTDRPHTHPWEMLGFSQKPIWWDQYYTWTTPSVRTQLISDIEQGIIRDGVRENYTNRSYLGNDNVYKKPGFSKYVPVDTGGNLLSPKQIGIISTDPSREASQAGWKFGDGAPVEHAFVTSTAYSYALQQLMYLTNPVSYMDKLWEVDNIQKAFIDKNQTIDKTSGRRPVNNNYYVHAETDSNNTRYYRSGIQNFISDYVIYQGNQVGIAFGDIIRNMQTNLMYRCAGFIDSTKLKIESEAYDSTSKSTNIIIPPEDINLNLYQGSSIQEAVYSACIVELTENGYKIYGYDTTNPYFNTYKQIKSGPSYSVKVGGKDIVPIGYDTGTMYHRDEVVVYNNLYYQCTVPHTSAQADVSPNLSYFKKINKLPQQGGTEVEHYTQFDYSNIVPIDFGTVFRTRQEVYDVIVGYGEYLKTQGWIFDQHNSDIGENLDWRYSAKEFLFWSLGKWKPGNYVTLSPSSQELKFSPSSGVVQSLTDIINGSYSALNKEGFGLNAKQLQVSRNDNDVTISHKNGVGIFGLRLYVKETEHSITLNNKTIFNDTIYNTLLAQRQPRVKISTVRSNNWNGKLEADGFIINDTSLINNFEKSVKDTLNFYDVDAEKVDTDFRDAAMHLIGYQERNYLTNLGVSKRNQVKLYQGMIKQKGTTNAIDRLLRSTTVSTDQSFDTYEEWAFKVGDFGSTNFNQQIELRVKAEDVVTDPLLFEFVLPTDNSAVSGYDSTLDEIVTIDIDDTERWLKKPTGEKTLANLWPTVSTVESNIPTAGYVHFNDPTYKAYDSTALDSVYGSQTGNVAIGSTAWVAKDVTGGKDWNAYKLYELNTKIDHIISNGDANTAMKVTVNGTGAEIGTGKKVILHKTYDGSGNLVINPTVWGTHTLTLVQGTPTAPTVTIPFANVAGSGAQLAVGNIAGTVASVTSTGGTGFATGDVITFTGTTGSGATATVSSESGGAPTGYTLNSGGSNYSTAPNGFTVKNSSGTAKTLGTDYTAPSFTFTGNGTGGVFGEIKDLVITNGGANYQAPTITITKSDASSISIASSDITVSGGAITAITVPGYSGSYANQGFSSGITSTATGSITVKDTKANFTVNLNTGLTKVHSLGSLTANVTTAWDGTSPSIVVESWDGSTATTLYTVPTANLQAVASSNISASGTVTDNANVTVRANVSVSSATTGNVTLTLNYTSKEYSITKPDGTAEFVTTADNTTINSSGIKLLDWKDVRLNRTLDSSLISTTVSDTLQNFLTSTSLNSAVWSEGDLVWLDNDSTGYWGVYRFTANSSIISTYNSIRGTESTAVSPSYGGTWILHSDVDYDDSTKTNATYFANTKRRQQDKVVTDQFEKAVIYDDRNNKVDLTLVPYDPAKGILPPQADREIEYKTEIDPAVYNNHSDTNEISTNKPWQDEYVGQVWWDLSTTRYIDYESHDNLYRRKYWGRLFPGASVDIYEWVKSSVAPESYTGSGTVKSTTNYSTKVKTDPSTTANITTYYFWVKNVTTVPALEGRTNDTSTVASVITSPITQGLNYFAPVSQNAISIANVLDFTTKQNTVLQLNYRKRNTDDKTNSKHAQWLLIRENYPDAPIQDQIWNKMVDSLVGFDRLNSTVPDMTLSINDRYGSSVRPRQSWFKDSKKARKVLFESMNAITSSILLDANHFGWNDDLTTAVYYEKTNWYYNASFSDDTVINRIVDYYTEINTSQLSRDDIIKVNYGYNSKWELWQYTDADYLAGTTTSYDSSNLSLVRVGLQTATAKLKTTVYTEADSTTMATELRAYIKAIKDNVLIAQNLKYQNDLLFAIIRYVNSEQEHVDWLFKSTYLNVVQQDTALTQKASFEKDPFNDVKTYIEEVKPYRTKIRNFSSKKKPVRENANMAMSDFTGTSDYALDTNTNKNTNPSPQVKTKMAFDRISTAITLVSPSVNVVTTWATSTSYTAGVKVKHKGAYWQCNTTHTSSNFVTDVQAGKWQHTNFEPTTEATDVAKINAVKSSTPTTTHVDRLAKYHYATELAAVDTANVDSVSSFVTTLSNKIGFYKDLDVQPIGFKVNRDRIGQELTTFAWDSLDWDGDAASSNPPMGYDFDSIQSWYDSNFTKASVWKDTVAYAKNDFVKHDDLTHLTAWSASNSYTVGDVVKHNNKIYVANVTHKNLTNETTLQTSRWDLINDRIYYTNVAHTSSTTFKTDYDAGKWILVKSQLDSAGFVRPNRDPNPEELAPVKPKESLMVTVKSNDNTDKSLQHKNITAITNANPAVVTSATAHGLSNGDQIELAQIKGINQLNNNVYTVANATATSFELSGIDTTEASITGYTTADPVVVTAPSHGYFNNDKIVISGVLANDGTSNIASDINGTFIIKNITANTFELNNSKLDADTVNGASYHPYASGGTALKQYVSGGIVRPVITGSGDLSQYKIHYTPYGTVDYLRDKFVDNSGTPSSTDDHTTLNGAITKSSNLITVTDATKIPTPKQIVNQVDNTVTDKPAVIWIGSERIEYSRVSGNVLSDVIRGTHGTTIQDHSNAVEVYSGDTHIPNAKSKGFWNDSATSLLNSTNEQANYLTNNENQVDYVSGDYVTPEDYVE